MQLITISKFEIYSYNLPLLSISKKTILSSTLSIVFVVPIISYPSFNNFLNIGRGRPGAQHLGEEAPSEDAPHGLAGVVRPHGKEDRGPDAPALHSNYQSSLCCL